MSQQRILTRLREAKCGVMTGGRAEDIVVWYEFSHVGRRETSGKRINHYLGA